MDNRWGSGSYPISVYIAAIAVGILVPFVLFVGLLVSQLEMRERRALENRAVETGRSISHVVERRLNDMGTTLRLLSSSPEIRTGDLRGLHNRTQAALAGSEWYVLAMDSEGQQLLNTRVPFGSPLGRTSNIDALHSALSSRKVTVSGVFVGRTSQEWVFNVIDPISHTVPSPIAALIITQNAADLSELISATSLPPYWSAVIVDQAGLIVATSNPSAGAVGEILRSELLDVSASSSGPLELTLDGQDSITSFALLAGGAWKMVLWGPIGSAQQSIVSTWRQLLLGGSVLAVVTGLLGYGVARKLRRSVRQLSLMAKDMGDAGVVSPVVTGIHELDVVAVALSEASFDRDTAERKVFLVMRELVHRTKNMLTVVQSMIRQTAHNKASEEFLPAVSERIVALAHSIDLLTANDWGGVSLKELIRTHLAPFIVDPDRVTTVGEDVLLTPDAVQNLGMVFHELATNAVKYGAFASVTGRVEIAWERLRDGEREAFRLTWTESGGPNVKNSRRRGFGTTVIEKHAEAAFRGKVSLQLNSAGLRWELVAPQEVVVWDKSRLSDPGNDADKWQQ